MNVERFRDSYVPEPNTGCFIWLANVRPDGYGRFRVDGRDVLAHRYAYATFVAPIPEGLTIDHLCRVRCCVNPAHLEPVTIAENVMRGTGIAPTNRQKILCKRGHPLDSVGYPNDRKASKRACRTCWRLKRSAAYWSNPDKYRAAQRRYNAAKKERV